MLTLFILIAQHRGCRGEADFVVLESELLGDAANNFYERNGANYWQATTRNIALDMLRCESACLRRNVSDSALSCPTAHLMDYLIRGAYGRRCDARPMYKKVSKELSLSMQQS